MNRLMFPSLRTGLLAGGLLLALSGLGYWGWMLARLPGASAPHAAPSAASVQDPAAESLAAWFGPGQVRVDVVVSGIVKGEGRAAVVLAVNGAPPQAYRVGDMLAQSVRLQAIERDAVVVDRDGEPLRFAAAVVDEPAMPGIVAVN